MTREEAIEILNRDDADMRGGYFCINDFLAIETLKQEPSEDCISRELVLRELGKYLCGVPFDKKGIDEVIKDLPSVQPKTKTAHWIVEVWSNREHHTCSECSHVVMDYESCYHYCPYCGAKMEGEG